jgi:hypothetical protein
MEQDCSRKTVRIVYYIAGTENVIDKHIPRNLLDNLTHKSSPLAEVALRSRNTGLDDSCLGFLHTRHTLAHRVSCNEVRILPCVHIRVYLHCTQLCPSSISRVGLGMKILQEVRRAIWLGFSAFYSRKFGIREEGWVVIRVPCSHRQ